MVSEISTYKKASSTQRNGSGKQGAVKASAGAFESYLLTNLKPDRNGKINEEELFSALIGERLSSLKGQSVSKQYRSELKDERQLLRTASGYVPEERCALRVLKRMARDGTLTAEEANQIYSEAFQAANLDQIENALYDSSGGEDDPTTAAMDINKAIRRAEKALENLQAGKVTLNQRELLSARPTGWPVPSIADTIPDPADAEEARRGKLSKTAYAASDKLGVPVNQKILST